MSTNQTKSPQSKNPTMEELLASQTKKLITLYRGQNIAGEVLSITDKEIVLDLGAKSEGVLLKRELSDAQVKDLKIGDKLQAFVSTVENESGQVILSMMRQTKSPGFVGKGSRMAWNRFIQAQNQKSRLQGVVLEVNKGGLIVEVDGTRGFLPNSQVGFELLSKSGQGLEKLVGQKLDLAVIEVDPNNNKLIFSQRGQVSDEVKDKLKAFNTGDKITGKIVAILPFGLVVDVEGLEGLVLISDVSWSKVEDLSKEFQVGQSIEVSVIGIDQDLGRLNLSIKQLSEDPFSKLAEKYAADEMVKGEIVNLTEAGVIVKLEEGVEGFLPASKIDPDTKYEVGNQMSFLVDSPDKIRRRINLAPFVTTTAGLIYK